MTLEGKIVIANTEDVLTPDNEIRHLMSFPVAIKSSICVRTERELRPLQRFYA